MSWVAAAIGGSALLGSMSARDAAKSQQNAANQGLQAQQQALSAQNEFQQPFRQAGLASQNMLLQLLGINTPSSDAMQWAKDVYAPQIIQHMADIGQPVGEGWTPSETSLTEWAKLAPNQERAADFGSLMKDFGTQDFQEDPGYAFRLSEGQKALDRSAAARGGLQSGAALKAAARYGQDMGSQEYQNAFNRYQTNRQNKLQPLMSLAGMGQAAASNQAGYAGQYGQGAAQAYGDIGNAQASGTMGQANAIAGGLGQYLNYQQGQNYLNALKRPSTYGNTSNSYVDPYYSQ